MRAAMGKWWCAGAFKQPRRERAGAASAAGENVALVVGSTDMVGGALVELLSLPVTPGGPWKIYAQSCLPPLPGASFPPAAAIYFHVDLADPPAVAEALAPLTDITHVFYAAWDPRREDDEDREANGAMLRNVLSVVVPNCPALVHVCLQTARKRCSDPFETGLNSVLLAYQPYSERLPRYDPPPGYPDLEDVLLVEFGGHAVPAPPTWSVHRTVNIFGFAPWSARNVITSLCVYAAICHKDRAKLRWPGSRDAWESFSEASDAGLVAEHALWAALEPSRKARNRRYNSTNGDIYKWKQLWPMLADHFCVGWTGYEGEDNRFRLEEAMAGKEAVWAEIVNEYGLVETELDKVANWWFLDGVINTEGEHVDTMNKSKEHGFLGFRNTVRSFNALIDMMKDQKIVPSPELPLY